MFNSIACLKTITYTESEHIYKRPVIHMFKAVHYNNKSVLNGNATILNIFTLQKVMAGHQ